LQILSSQSDEVARVNAVCRLAGWQDELVHNTLTKHGESDASPEVRAACGEALSDFWWWQLQTRRWIQDRIALDESPQTRDDLFAALKKARKKLAEVWVARLSNPSDKEKVLETVSGYPALRVFKFRLRNIGPFTDTRDVVLRSGVNVFLGDNAAGKTTLLKCLALAAIGYHAANEVEGNPLGYLRKGTKDGKFMNAIGELLPKVTNLVQYISDLLHDDLEVPLCDEHFDMGNLGLASTCCQHNPLAAAFCQCLQCKATTLLVPCVCVCVFAEFLHCEVRALEVDAQLRTRTQQAALQSSLLGLSWR
jgi:hypothetical protein